MKRELANKYSFLGENIKIISTDGEQSFSLSHGESFYLEPSLDRERTSWISRADNKQSINLKYGATQLLKVLSVKA